MEWTADTGGVAMCGFPGAASVRAAAAEVRGRKLSEKLTRACSCRGWMSFAWRRLAGGDGQERRGDEMGSVDC